MSERGVDDSTVLERPEFIREVWRRLDEDGDPPEVAPIRHRHGIVEYRFADRRRLFAKPFAEAADARSAYEIQGALWRGGFGPGSAHRVPEPVALVHDERVILMAAASGERMRELATAEWTTWADALESAARWLAALHGSPHRLGPPDDAARRALHLARRLAQTVARRADLERVLTSLVDELAARIPAVSSREVQTHGRYHPQHVYVGPEFVTVIDTDRASPGDAAKDVGEFLHRLRVDAVRAGIGAEAADRASTTFVDEYRRVSAGDLSALGFYWSYSILFTLVARAGRAEVEDEDERARIQLLEAEFAAVPRRVAAYGA